jgi:penicillin G amidase
MARRILFIILGVILALVAIVAIAGFFFVRTPFPDTDGTVQVPDAAAIAQSLPGAGETLQFSTLQSPVTIYRDEYGVPQIYADNLHDLFFAQGYVQAQDRLFQMDFQRRVGTGTLSEVLGEATLETDRFLRTLGTGRAAAKDLEVMSQDTLSDLQAYADGVNAFISANQDNLPLEFRILGYKPQPWVPLHSVVWGKMMAWNLGDNWETELMRARLLDTMGEEKTADLLQRYPESGPFIIPSEVKSYASLKAIDFDKVMAVKRLLKATDPDLGSNNWVVAGSHTTTGKPLVANDPHLGMQIPSIWYLVGLHGGGLDVVGASLAGAPGVVIGHNDRIAWGVTNVGPDVQDLFLEKVNPDNPNQAEFEGKWEDMQVVEERIAVKGQAEPVVETVRITRHGPIMNAVTSKIGEEAQPMAFRWTALDGGKMFESILNIDQAQNWEEFRTALRDFVVPSQNFVYADVDGNIGYQMPGQIPIRAKGDGTVPVPGWTGEYEWTGTIPFDELPYVYNPEVGYVATANNQVVPDSYPYLISTDWAAPYRAERIIELIESKDKLSPDDFAAIQGDIRPVPTDSFVPVLGGIDLSAASKEVQTAQQMMIAWDRKMDADAPEPLIYEAYVRKLAQETFGDELIAAGGDELAQDFLSSYRNKYTLTLIDLLDDSTNTWWDDVRTTEVETENDIVTRAFAAAIAELQASYGQAPDRWQWGKPHFANFDHLVFGEVSPLDSIFNRSIPARGTNFTVNAASPAYDTLAMDAGASYRHIVDLSNLANSRFIHTTGQSGLAFNPHYDDLIPIWQNVEYLPMRFDRAEIEKSAKDVLVLEPKQ